MGTVPVPVEYLPSDVAVNVRIELDEARGERDRALSAIALKVTRGQIHKIEPDELERVARIVRAVRLLGPMIESSTRGG